MSKRTRFTLPVNPGSARSALWLGIAMAMSACGSGGDSGDSTNGIAPFGQVASVDVSAGDNSAPADGVETTVLQQNAARNAATAINVNALGVRSFSSTADRVSTLTTAQPGSLLDDALTASDDIAASSLLNDALVASVGGAGSNLLGMFSDSSDGSGSELESESERLLLATLGLDKSGGAVSTREGNRIMIDPDDAAVCAGDTFILDDQQTADSKAHCMQLVSALSVQLDAITEQSGEITYLFNQQPLLIVGYGPRNVMYELKLDTLHQVEMMSGQLAGETGTVPTTQRGAIRLVATVDNESEGRESGTMALAISEPVFIQQADGERITLSPSTVFTLAHNEENGTTSLSLGLGALEFVFNDTDDFTGAVTGKINKVALGGLTGRFDVSDNGEQLDVSNFGLVNGPMNVTTGDSMDAAITIAPFGFSLSEASGNLTLNTAMNFGLSANQYDAQQGNFSFDIGVTSPARTVIDTQSESPGNTVRAGGPLQLNYSVSAGSGSSENGYVSWLPGSCEAASGDNGFELFSCEDGLDL